MRLCQALLLLAPLINSCLLFGQSTNAALTGVVDDPSKAVVVGAQVTAINTETGVKSSTITNNDGVYAIRGLLPGTYRVEVDKQGFRGIIEPGVVLHVQDILQLNFHMALGSMTETVTVETGGLNINTTDASVSTVIDRQFAENLPLNGRSFQSLIYLTPGVTQNAGAGGGPNSGWTTGQFSVNGQRTGSNYWMVDGVSANIGISPYDATANASAGGVGAFNVLGGTNSLVSVDAMQEFRIQTSTYAPEFGRVPGGQISIVTRSGTNQFHGTLFDYFRNTVLDATDWFAKREGLPKAAEQQNDFGGVLGGPVIKDKTFFFFSYEGLRLNLPQTALTTVPDLAARQNAIPAVRPFLDAYPLPNAGAADSCQSCGYAPFNATFSDPSSVDAYSIRLDHSLTKSINLFGRYNQSPSSTMQRAPGSYTANTVTRITSRTKTGTVGATWTKSSEVVNEARFNYSTSVGLANFTVDTFGGAAVGSGATLLPGPYTTHNAEFLFLPSFGTKMWWADGFDSQNVQHQYNMVDTLSVQKGHHSMKFGVDYRRLTPYLAFRSYSLQPYFSDMDGLETGQSSATGLLSSAPATFLLHNLGLFAQDTWRGVPRLTLTCGLRWDIDFRPTTESGPSIPAVTGFSHTDLSNLALATAGTPVYSTRYGGFAPRIGGAYQISQAPDWGLVFRGGVGVFYDLAGETELGDADVFSYPYENFVYTLNVPFPPSPAQKAPPAIIPPDATQGTLAAFDPHLNLPYTLQWSAALEQALGRVQTLTISYVGSLGRRLLASESITAPNPDYASAFLIGNAGSSNYNALHVQFQRRLSKGFQALASYAWSHAIDTGSSASYTDGSFADINVNRGPSDFDVRNTFSAALTYEVPVVEAGPFARAILGGWSTENIFHAYSASPVDVIDQAFFALSAASPSVVVRPDLVSGQPIYLYGSEYPGHKALNPNAFTNPPIDPATGLPTRQGDLARNAVGGFGLTQWDFAVHRDFPIRENIKLQFRAEMFNVLNHPSFAPYDNNFGVGDPNFGQSTQMLNQYSGSAGGLAGAGGLSAQYALGGPRSIQLALKLFF